MQAGAVAVADEDEGAGPRFQHEGEILAAHQRRRVGVDASRRRPRRSRPRSRTRSAFVVPGHRIVPVVGERRLGAVGLGGPLHDLAQPVLQRVAHLGQQAARGAAQGRGLRDHVVGRAGVELADRDQAGLDRIDAARDDRLRLADDLRADHHRIDARCGFAACEPSPSISMTMRSAAASSGPGRIANSPTGRPGMLCMP